MTQKPSGFISESLSEFGGSIGEKTFLKRRPRPPVDKAGNSLKGKTAIVTGANRGIGKETVAGLLQRGCRVILACRDTGLGREAADELIAKYPNGEVVVMELDLASFPSVRKFSKDVIEKESKIDFLIQNAGIITSSSRVVKPEDIDGHEGLETTMVVNYFSQVLLTTLLYNKMKATPDSKILFVSAIAYLAVSQVDLDDKTFRDGLTGTYALSKLAQIMFAKKLSSKALTDGIRVYGVDPGVSPSDLSRDFPLWQRAIVLGPGRLFARSVKDSANSALCLVLKDDKESFDTQHIVFRDGKPRGESAVLNNQAEVDALWKKTKEMLKLNFEM